MRFCMQVPYKVNVISCLFKPLKKNRKLKNWDIIIKIVGEVLELNMASIKGKSRKRDFVSARSIAVYFIQHYNKGLTLEQIGAIMNREHSWVLYMIKKCNDWNFSDPKFKSKYQLIAQKIKRIERDFE